MTSAFEELFSIANAFHDIPMAGRTDAWILSDAAAAHGIPADSADLARFPDVYVRHLAAEIAASEQRGTTPFRGGRYGVMPGVRALLDALIDQPDAYLALLTGNYETGARLKLEHFDLWRYFRSGAFGDGAADRNGLVPKALARVAAGGGPAFASSDAVVIGDTPLDVACAKAGGARLIAVATGNHSIDELRAAGADVVFEDLSDTGAVVQSIFRK
jgi:phosphoglycolate phosphatase-like HAD superfamily hydrolase